MLVVDLNALHPVHVLDFLDQVGGQFLHAEQAQNIVRVGFAVGDHFTLLDVFAVEHPDMPPLRDQLLIEDVAVLVANHQALFTLGFLTEFDDAGFFGEDSRFLGLACLEQIRNPWQTAGNITGLGRLLRNTGDDVTHRQFSAVGYVDDGTSR